MLHVVYISDDEGTPTEFFNLVSQKMQSSKCYILFILVYISDDGGTPTEFSNLVSCLKHLNLLGSDIMNDLVFREFFSIFLNYFSSDG